MVLQIKAKLKIQKPVSEVFEAIVDPAKMSNYFISKSSGRMETGKTINWRFPEFDMEFPIRVDKTQAPNHISYFWSDPGGTETRVEITLEPNNPNETQLTITEGTRPLDEEGIKWYGGNTEGWANFLACLKAWIEHGINLRKGAF